MPAASAASQKQPRIRLRRFGHNTPRRSTGGHKSITGHGGRSFWRNPIFAWIDLLFKRSAFAPALGYYPFYEQLKPETLVMLTHCHTHKFSNQRKLNIVSRDMVSWPPISTLP